MEARQKELGASSRRLLQLADDVRTFSSPEVQGAVAAAGGQQQLVDDALERGAGSGGAMGDSSFWEEKSKHEIIAVVYAMRQRLISAQDKIRKLSAQRDRAIDILPEREQRRGDTAPPTLDAEHASKEAELKCASLFAQMKMLESKLARQIELVARYEAADQMRSTESRELRAKLTSVVAENARELRMCKTELATERAEASRLRWELERARDTSQFEVESLRKELQWKTEENARLESQVRAEQELCTALRGQKGDRAGGALSGPEQDSPGTNAYTEEVNALRQELRVSQAREQEAQSIIVTLRAALDYDVSPIPQEGDRAFATASAHRVNYGSDSGGFSGGSKVAQQKDLNSPAPEESLNSKEQAQIIRALRKEKSRLVDLIASLSDTGKDVHAGAARLQELAKQPAAAKGTKSGGGTDRISSSPPVEAAPDSHWKEAFDRSKAEADSTTSEVIKLRETSSKLQSTVQAQALEIESLRSALKRLERRAARLETELKALYGQLQTFEEEEGTGLGSERERARIMALTVAKEEAERSARELEATLRENDERSAAFQTELVGLRELLRSLGTGADDASTPGGPPAFQGRLRGRLLELQRELATRATEAAKLRERLEALERELDEARKSRDCTDPSTLAGRAADSSCTGASTAQVVDAPSMEPADHDPSSTKIVRFRSSFCSRCCTESKTKPDSDAPGSGQKRARADAGTFRPVGEDEESGLRSTKDEIGKLQMAMQQAEKRALRTRDAAKKKIEEFRLACFHLLGWRVDVSGALYTFTSTYAETPHQFLRFGQKEDGGFELMESPYCSELQVEIESVLKRFSSIPAFLAQLTLDSFGKSTVFQSIENS
ncbi:Mitotic spindle assembly checkpoint protein MAD1 [Porphyridium purpureum]|uniref:Mitotic spindle assembly checkpoint protein MAD1 n=1 Tax=Porphyridium purpureum TaxID=35688 RepID=A0A5J4YU47_PORPP|nr:Mitotic spindle assembly checkpoint protein MAD1 [Porphyridium purpureum]|eukprot:POR9480..scf229_5